MNFIIEILFRFIIMCAIYLWIITRITINIGRS
jgi:hypothetical protein